MALAAEQVFIVAVAKAEGTRQVAKAAALATFVAAGFTSAANTTYIAALLAADVAYVTAVNAAANTSALTVGTVGLSGPIPCNQASIVGMM